MFWTYAQMYAWYTKQHMISDDKDPPEILAIVYESKKPSKKSESVLEPFIKRNIIHVGLSPVQDDNLFPKKVFLVYDDNNSDKKWLYFVTPRVRPNFIAADHFTFCHDKSDKKNACHFHSTQYAETFIENKVRYYTTHIKDFMPDKLDLPEEINNVFTNHETSKPFLVKTIKYPWSQQVGGVANKPTKTLSRPIRNHAFCQFWVANRFTGMTAFGIKKGKTYHWTVCFKEKGRFIPSKMYDAFYFTTRDTDDHEAKLMEYIVSATV